MATVSATTFWQDLTTYELEVLQILAEQDERRVVYTPRRYRPLVDEWVSLCELFGKPNSEHVRLREALRQLEQHGCIVVQRHHKQAGKAIVFLAA